MSQDSGLGMESLPDLSNKRTSKRKFIRESWQPAHPYHASMASLLNFIQTNEFDATQTGSWDCVLDLDGDDDSSYGPTCVDDQPDPSPNYQDETTSPLPVAIKMPSILERPEIQLLIQEFRPLAVKRTVNPVIAQDLHFAIDRKDENMVFRLLRDGTDPNIRNRNAGTSPLHRAFGVKSFEIAVFLILAGAKLEKKNKAGDTALIRAVKCQFPDDIIALICELGANVDARDHAGRTALHYAADSVASDDNTILALVGYGADLEVRDKEGRTALHIAAAYGRTKTVQQLVEYGADIEARMPNGMAALHIAISKRNVPITNFLCDNGARLNDKFKDSTPLTMAIDIAADDVARVLIECGAIVNFRDPKGGYPLLSAAAAGNLKVVKLLLSLGADLNMVSPAKSAPMHKAAQGNWVDIVRALVDAGAPVDPLDSSGATPLLLAVQDGHVDTVRLLVESGADVEHTTDDHLPILWHAIDNGQSEAAMILLEDCAGASANPVRMLDKSGTTPLHHAARKGLESVVDLILERGAYVDTRDRAGRTPLFYAAAAGQLATVRLLQHKWCADVAARTSADNTVLSVCAARHPETLRFLVGLKAARHGSGAVSPRGWSIKSRPALDVNHRNEHGATALHYAALGGNMESAKLLLAKGAKHFVATEVDRLIDEETEDNDNNDHDSDGDTAHPLQGTPAELARQTGYVEVALLLEKSSSKHR